MNNMGNRSIDIVGDEKDKYFIGKQYSISLIRLFSLIFIITCHILQYLNNELAWWFNVGVQLFFCISGFLYGQRKTGEITKFYSKRFKRIYIPYIIVFITYAILLFAFARETFSPSSFILGLFTHSTLKGGGHLWFVAYILMCYLITPIIEAYRDRYVNNLKRMWGFAIGTFLCISLYFGLFNDYFSPARMSCYVLGYAIGVNEKSEFISNKILIWVFTVLALVSNAMQIYIDYIAKLSFSGKIGTIYAAFCQYSHVLLGVFLFLLMKMVFDRIVFGLKARRILNITDKYSYEVYLVHQFIILGPFSLMALTPFLSVNIIIIIIGILMLALVLERLETHIMKIVG